MPLRHWIATNVSASCSYFLVSRRYIFPRLSCAMRGEEPSWRNRGSAFCGWANGGGASVGGAQG